MSNEIVTAVVGNLTADPELRYTQNGLPVVNFTIASTTRVFKDGQFVDGETTFVRCSAWRDYAEHIAASLQKGSNVIAKGAFKQRDYETKEGEKRSSMEFEVEELGSTLRFGTTVFTRAAKSNGGQPAAATQAPAAAAVAQAAPVAQVAPVAQAPVAQAPVAAAPVAVAAAPVAVAAPAAAVAYVDDNEDF